jgi:hypothetical protein
MATGTRATEFHGTFAFVLACIFGRHSDIHFAIVLARLLSLCRLRLSRRISPSLGLRACFVSNKFVSFGPSSTDVRAAFYAPITSARIARIHLSFLFLPVQTVLVALFGSCRSIVPKSHGKPACDIATSPGRPTSKLFSQQVSLTVGVP